MSLRHCSKSHSTMSCYNVWILNTNGQIVWDIPIACQKKKSKAKLHYDQIPLKCHLDAKTTPTLGLSKLPRFHYIYRSKNRCRKPTAFFVDFYSTIGLKIWISTLFMCVFLADSMISIILNGGQYILWTSKYWNGFNLMRRIWP